MVRTPAYTRTKGAQLQPNPMNASPCPHCHTIVDPDTGRCLCRPARQAGDGSPELLARAEALFESYLAARVVHARRRLNEAKAAFLRDPRNRAKAESFHAAEREVGLLEMQLVEQTRKTQHARSLARTATPLSSSAGPPSPPEPPVRSATDCTGTRERDCPRCGARMPSAVAECRCGFVFEHTRTAAEPMFLGDEALLTSRRGTK